MQLIFDRQRSSEGGVFYNDRILKNIRSYCPLLRRKTFLVMKLTAILLLAFCLQVTAGGNAQGITISEKNVPLQKVFSRIEEQTGFNFFYKIELISQARKVSIDVRNASLEQVLNICFRDQP